MREGPSNSTCFSTMARVMPRVYLRYCWRCAQNRACLEELRGSVKAHVADEISFPEWYAVVAQDFVGDRGVKVEVREL